MIFFDNLHQNFVKNIRFPPESKLLQISIKNIRRKIASQKHQRWHHCLCLQLNWLDLDLDYMVCTNWRYIKYLKISQDLKKYCILKNMHYVYLVPKLRKGFRQKLLQPFHRTNFFNFSLRDYTF